MAAFVGVAYRDLQKLAKENGIKANGKREQLIIELAAKGVAEPGQDNATTNTPRRRPALGTLDQHLVDNRNNVAAAGNSPAAAAAHKDRQSLHPEVAKAERAAKVAEARSSDKKRKAKKAAADVAAARKELERLQNVLLIQNSAAEQAEAEAKAARAAATAAVAKVEAEKAAAEKAAREKRAAAAAAATAAAARAAAEKEDDDDDEVVDITEEVLRAKRAEAVAFAASTSSWNGAAAGGAGGGGGGGGGQVAADDVEVVGHRGTAAGVDMPHSREECGVFPFATTHHTQACKNCFCFVCDKRAYQCKQWASHCHARYADPMWRKKRETARKVAEAEKAVAAVNAAVNVAARAVAERGAAAGGGGGGAAQGGGGGGGGGIARLGAAGGAGAPGTAAAAGGAPRLLGSVTAREAVLLSANLRGRRITAMRRFGLRETVHCGTIGEFDALTRKHAIKWDNRGSTNHWSLARKSSGNWTLSFEGQDAYITNVAAFETAANRRVQETVPVPSTGSIVFAYMPGRSAWSAGRVVRGFGDSSIDFMADTGGMQHRLTKDNYVAKGRRIRARYMRRDRFYDGKVVRIHFDGTVDVAYNDGAFESRVPMQFTTLASQ